MARRSSADAGPSTRLLHALSGRNAVSLAGAGIPMAPPIWQTATFAYDRPEDVAADAAAVAPSTYYSRYGNPNLAAVGEAVAGLEGAEKGLVVGSGMGAISLVMLGLLHAGDHVVAQTSHYVGTAKLLARWLPRFGVEVTAVEPTDTDGFAGAVRPTTRLIYVETPTNPTLALVDLAAVGELGRSRGILTCCDNTFATPANQRPLEHGIDLVVHSATKFLAGHHDVTAGAIAGSAERVDAVWEALIVFGMVQHPLEAWLLGRGLETFPLRMQQVNASAQRVAERLADHPKVARVFYPGLPSHPQHELARRQMKGFGGLIAVDLAGGYEGARAFIERLRVFELGVSLGGTKSLAVHPASMVFPHLTSAERARAGVSEGLVRLSIGLENVEDLLADVRDAL